MHDIHTHLQIDTLHHAYLFGGNHEDILPEIFVFLNALKVPIINNPDYVQIILDSFKAEEAENLRTMSVQKAFGLGKKVFVIAAESFSLDAQQMLLKLFEEPILDTHFFVITPDTNALIRTLHSRFYSVPKSISSTQTKEAEKFLKSDNRARIEYLKELLEDEDEEDGAMMLHSPRSKALSFLNSLEYALHAHFLKTKTHQDKASYFEHMFKVRQFLRQPGSSAKSLMESVALVVPKY